MISNYIVAVQSHSPRYGHDSAKYLECNTYEEATTYAKREAEYMDTIGRMYEINIYINENAREKICDHYGRSAHAFTPVCMAQPGMPRAQCDGLTIKCPYIHKGGVK